MRTTLAIGALAWSVGLGVAPLMGQQAAMPTTVDGFLSAAKDAAGTNFSGTFLRLCVPPPPPNPAGRGRGGGGGGGGGGRGGPPPRESWYAEPAQVGDNLYFLGTMDHNSFALVAESGDIILIDALFDYATPAEIVGGLETLGLDPNDVRYVVISHAHGDHDGGVKYLQDRIPGVTILYGEGDWPSVTARGAAGAVRSGPQNDGTDGRVVSAGDQDVSVRLVTMPGHTPGTLSFLFEFEDGGDPIRVAYVGGTAISFTNTDPAYYDEYIESSAKFAHAAEAFGATALMSNHSEFDLGYLRSHAAASRSSRDDVPNPYDIGAQGVADYFEVVRYCASAAKLRATGRL
ncbi:MAG: MBL fold metallo-hydrolase [Gemmatimonadetes bacterium]|nr:MBL fold metallo-hydrolase [Gemmatimonadota bacterium]